MAYSGSTGLKLGFGPTPIQKILYNQTVKNAQGPKYKQWQEDIAKKYGVDPGQVHSIGGDYYVRKNGGFVKASSLTPVTQNSSGSGLPGAVGDAYDKATKANEERYQEIKGEYGTLLDDALGMSQDRQQYLTGLAGDRLGAAMGLLNGMGQGEAVRINRAYDDLAARQHQNLTSRGLSASTIAPTVQSAVERDRQDSLMRLGDSLRGSYLNAFLPASGDYLNTAAQTSGGNIDLLTGITQNKLGFMERRNDVYPDLGLFAQIAQSYGQGQYGRTPYSYNAAAAYTPQYNIPAASYGAPMGVISTSAYGDGVPGTQYTPTRNTSIPGTYQWFDPSARV